MPRYAPELSASVLDQYLHTGKSVAQIAHDHAIDERDVTRIRHAAGIPPRRTRERSLPPAMAALLETRALLRAQTPPPERGRACPGLDPGSDCEAVRVGVTAAKDAADPSPDWLRQSDPPLSGEGEEKTAPAIDRIERLVEQELAAEEASRAQLGLLPRSPSDAERCARTLAILTRTLQALARLRGGAAGQGPHHDNDIPADIDEFRHALARRIEAFLESREAQADAGASAGPVLVDGAR